MKKKEIMGPGERRWSSFFSYQIFASVGSGAQKSPLARRARQGEGSPALGPGKIGNRWPGKKHKMRKINILFFEKVGEFRKFQR